jgi:hypothetical protein
MWRGHRVWAIVLAAVLTEPAYAEPPSGPKLYRYTRDDGTTVLDFSVPPQFVHRGYTVLSQSGNVIEVVPPSLSVEQREAMAAREPERIKALEDEARQRDEDRRLLALYSSPTDAERARDRKLEVLQLQISGDRGNIARLQSDLTITHELAANRERSGLEVPQDVIDKIDSLSRQVKGLDEGVKKREEDARLISESYQRDIDRMRFLIDNPHVVAALRALDASRRGDTAEPAKP